MHPQLVRVAIRALAGRQVTDVDDLYQMIGGESRPSAIPRVVRSGLADLLRALGYRQKWVLNPNSARCGFKWVREPWPIEVATLGGQAVETYTNFD